jgi:hypothetical protein
MLRLADMMSAFHVEHQNFHNIRKGEVSTSVKITVRNASNGENLPKLG